MKASEPQSFKEVLEKDCCKYIEGDIKYGTAKFCGNSRDGRSPYCKEHSEKCFNGLGQTLTEKVIDFLASL